MKVHDFPPDLREILILVGFQDDSRIFTNNGYPCGWKNGKIKYVHRLVAEHFHSAKLSRRLFVHHKDEDRSNFRPSNLEVMSHGQHNGQHRQFGGNNHFFGKKHSDETLAYLRAIGVERGAPELNAKARKKISASLRQRWKNPEYRRHMSGKISEAKKKPKTELICAACNNKFYVPPSRASARFCSMDCTTAARKQNLIYCALKHSRAASS